MTEYRRNFQQGGCYFFTVTLNDRHSSLLIDRIDALRNAFRDVQQRHPFVMDAVVILPEHLHAIWTLPENDSDFSTRWRQIKASFSRTLPADEMISNSRIAKGERGIWQRRFWEHTLRDETDFERHCDYIHFNPVKHGHVSRVRDWPYSSFARMVRSGSYPEDWGGEAVGDQHGFGER
ncbi:REP-associated tyrosine transposase [Tardiphaga sp. 768_D3_N2_1]|uniref:REP-associated tyrosine transposase n=1 Tax=Tardiphaga sp. 768_D3_N2_1 TaxID=3240783 RepID=UPI003F88F208